MPGVDAAVDLGRVAWRLEQHAAALADTSIPVIGRARTAAKRVAEWTSFHARIDALAAAQLLEQAGLSSNAAVVREAAALLESTPPRTGALRRAGAALDSLAAQVPDREALVARWMRDPEYEAATILVQHPERVSAAQWARLHELVLDDIAGETIRLPRYNGTQIKHMRDITRYRADVAAGRKEHAKPWFRLDYNVDHHFSGWAAAQLPKAQRQQVALELAARDPADLSKRDWAMLSGLLRDPIPGLPTQLDDLRPFDEVAWGRWSNISYADGADRYFARWQSRLDPEHVAAVDAAVDAVAGGTATDAQRMLVAGEWDMMSTHLQGRSAEHQATIAAVMLDAREGSGAAGFHTLEKSLRGRLDALRHLPLPRALESVRADAIMLAERNVLRLDGVHPEGAVRGYGRHPDYAELGRIREAWSLLRTMSDEHLATSARQGADSLRW